MAAGPLGGAARVPSVNGEAPGVGEAALARPEFPTVVLAAAVLAAERVSGLLVGSAALLATRRARERR